MNLSSETTQIILERGVEDRGLVGEINSLFATLLLSPKDLAAGYPRLWELKQKLSKEVLRG